jgi:glycosyltransferase involved in cell wall biosynthesis
MELVSCLMVTYDRPEQFKNSFACFCDQDYDPKELIVVTAGSAAYQAYIRDQIAGRRDVRCVVLPSPAPLGTLRNISVSHARGRLVCQWDDDDLHHPRRLSAQIGAMRMTGARVSFLADYLHYFAEAKQLYWCDCTRSARHVGLPGTLLAYKDAVPQYDDSLTRDEDAGMEFQLIEAGTPTVVLNGAGYLYMYVYHGRNTFDKEHHLSLTRRFGVESQTLRQRRALIDSALRQYGFEGVVSVADHNGRVVLRWVKGHGCSPTEALRDRAGSLIVKNADASGSDRVCRMDEAAIYGHRGGSNRGRRRRPAEPVSTGRGLNAC